MTALPRAISGPVMCMARPSRPPLEAELVRRAAAIVQQETGLTSARAQSGEIARRVGAELLKQQDADPLDILFVAIDGNPFERLAADPTIGIVATFTERRIERVRSRHGRYLPPLGDAAERRAIVAEMLSKLAARYDWQLRRG